MLCLRSHTLAITLRDPNSAADRREQVLDFLLFFAGYDIIDEVDGAGATALHRTAKEGHQGVVEALVKARCDKDKATATGATPMYVAAAHGHAKVVQALIKARCDKDKATRSGATPLYVAAQNGHAKVVQALIKAGGDKDKTTRSGTTPLYVAAQNGHAKVVKALIKAGGDQDKATNGQPSLTGKDSLLKAAEFYQSSFQDVDELLEKLGLTECADTADQGKGGTAKGYLALNGCHFDDEQFREHA